MEWISVVEKYPEFYEPVLTIYRTKDALSAITIRFFSEDYIWLSDEFRRCEKKNVTHWMPLPEPPEEVIEPTPKYEFGALPEPPESEDK